VEKSAASSIDQAKEIVKISKLDLNHDTASEHYTGFIYPSFLLWVKETNLYNADRLSAGKPVCALIDDKIHPI
jgi:hypothetical protein